MRRNFIYLKILASAFIIFYFSVTSYSQAPSRDLFNIIFENNFEDDQTGDYTSSDFFRDWVNPTAILRNTTVDIIREDDGLHNKFMRGYYPQGTISPHNGGYLWESDITGNNTEIYYSYDIRFKPGFQWVMGGKIPGVAGGNTVAGKVPDYNDGFAVRMMWRDNGGITFYVYHQDQQSIYGSSYIWDGFQFMTGRWYNLTLRIVLNTVSNGVGNNDGILEGYINGNLKFQKNNFRFRNNESIYLDRALLETFFGGNTSEWNSKADEWMDTDNFVVFTYKSTTPGVPSGRTTVSPDWKLVHPLYNFTNTDLILPSAPTVLKAHEVSESSISVAWKDNSNNEEGFIISRSLASEPQNVVEITVNANDTSFKDMDVKKGTAYVYSVKAVNIAGYSEFSNKTVAATLSVAETKRVRDGLIAYYNFAFNPDKVVYDVSGYGDPLNLRLSQASACEWNKDGILNIRSNTSVVSFNPAQKIISELRQSTGMTFEFWIKPEEPSFDGTGRVFSIGSSNDNIGFVLDQEIVSTPEGRKLYYTARLNTPSTNTSGYPELKPENPSFSYINMHHVVYTRDGEGNESIWVDGNKISEGFRPGDISSWSDYFYLRLGNENGLGYPWKGNYYVVAVYKKALSGDEILKNYNAGPRDDLKSQGVSYNVNVYPNPAREIANVEVSPQNIPDISAPSTLRIVDMHGKILYEKDLFNPTAEFFDQISVDTLIDGFYFMQVVSGNEQTAFKFIKE